MKLLVMCAALSMAFVLGVGAQENQVSESDLPIQSDQQEPAEEQQQISVFSTWDFVRMVLILGAVIGAIYGLFYLLKRSGSPNFQENRLIRVLSSRALSNSRSLHLVEVGNQVFLVGAADDSVSLLSEISDKETLDGIKLQAAQAEPAERRRFSDVFGTMFKKNGDSPSTGGALEVLQQQRQRLKHL